jgi:hypothetical protein
MTGVSEVGLGRILCGIGESQNLAAYGVGCEGDTSPLKGCCTVTFGYRARTC